MPCATCGHSLANVGIVEAGRRVFWCSRCGSLKTERTLAGQLYEDGSEGLPRTFEATETPKLVERVRGILHRAKADADAGYGHARGFLDVFHQRGVTESVFKPEDRP